MSREGWVGKDDLIRASRWKLPQYRSGELSLELADFASNEAYITFYLSLQNAKLGFAGDGDDLREPLVEKDGRLTTHAQDLFAGKVPDPLANFETFLSEVGSSMSPGENVLSLDDAIKAALRRRGYR